MVAVKIKMPIHSGKARQQNKQEDKGYRKLRSNRVRILSHLKLCGVCGGGGGGGGGEGACANN